MVARTLLALIGGVWLMAVSLPYAQDFDDLTTETLASEFDTTPSGLEIASFPGTGSNSLHGTGFSPEVEKFVTTTARTFCIQFDLYMPAGSSGFGNFWPIVGLLRNGPGIRDIIWLQHDGADLYLNGFGGSRTVSDVFSPDTTHHVRFSGACSSSAGGDAFFEVEVDGTVVISESELEFGGDALPNGDLGYESLYIGAGGTNYIDNLRVGETCGTSLTTPDIPIDRSAKCCGSDAVPGSGAPSPGAGVERPRLAVPGWTEPCTGGGTVDAVADLDDGERWG